MAAREPLALSETRQRDDRERRAYEESRHDVPDQHEHNAVERRSVVAPGP